MVRKALAAMVVGMLFAAAGPRPEMPTQGIDGANPPLPNMEYSFHGSTSNIVSFSAATTQPGFVPLDLGKLDLRAPDLKLFYLSGPVHQSWMINGPILPIPASQASVGPRYVALPVEMLEIGVGIPSRASGAIVPVDPTMDLPVMAPTTQPMFLVLTSTTQPGK